MRQKAVRVIKIIALAIIGILCFAAVFVTVVFFRSGPAPHDIEVERLAGEQAANVTLEEAVNALESEPASVGESSGGETGGDPAGGGASGASPPLSVPESGHPGWQSRELETIGIGFSLPKEFTKDHETPNDAVFASYDLKKKTGEERAKLDPGEVQLSIYTLEKKSGQDIAGFLETAFTSSAVDVKREKLKLAGRDALFETGRDTNLYAAYHIDRGDSLLSLTVYGNDADFEKNKTLLKQVIETIQIKEGSN